jgi:hypothetical protein
VWTLSVLLPVRDVLGGRIQARQLRVIRLGHGDSEPRVQFDDESEEIHRIEIHLVAQRRGWRSSKRVDQRLRVERRSGLTEMESRSHYLAEPHWWT